MYTGALVLWLIISKDYIPSISATNSFHLRMSLAATMMLEVINWLLIELFNLDPRIDNEFSRAKTDVTNMYSCHICCCLQLCLTRYLFFCAGYNRVKRRHEAVSDAENGGLAKNQTCPYLEPPPQIAPNQMRPSWGPVLKWGEKLGKRAGNFDMTAIVAALSPKNQIRTQYFSCSIT